MPTYVLVFLAITLLTALLAFGGVAAAGVAATFQVVFQLCAGVAALSYVHGFMQP